MYYTTILGWWCWNMSIYLLKKLSWPCPSFPTRIITIFSFQAITYNDGGGDWYVYVYIYIYIYAYACKCAEVCWNSNSSTTSNTLDLLWTPSAQQARRLFVWISFYQSPLLWFKYPGPLPVLRTEWCRRVSESFFSFYIDYPSQK